MYQPRKILKSIDDTKSFPKYFNDDTEWYIIDVLPWPFQSMLINGTPMTLTRPYACCMSSRIRVEIACSSQRGVKNKSRAVIFVMGKAFERMVERTWKSQGNPPNGSEWSWNSKEILLKLSLFQKIVAWSNEFFVFFARFLPRKKQKNCCLFWNIFAENVKQGSLNYLFCE